MQIRNIANLEQNYLIQNDVSLEYRYIKAFTRQEKKCMGGKRID